MRVQSPSFVSMKLYQLACITTLALGLQLATLGSATAKTQTASINTLADHNALASKAAVPVSDSLLTLPSFKHPATTETIASRTLASGYQPPDNGGPAKTGGAGTRVK